MVQIHLKTDQPIDSKITLEESQQVAEKLLARFSRDRQIEIETSCPQLLAKRVFVSDEDCEHPFEFFKNIFRNVVSGLPYCGTHIIPQTKLENIQKNIGMLFNVGEGVDPDIAYVFLIRAVELAEISPQEKKIFTKRLKQYI